MTNDPVWFGAPSGPPMPGFAYQAAIERQRLLSNGTTTTAILAVVTTVFGLMLSLLFLIAEGSTTEAETSRIVGRVLAAFCVGTLLNPVVFNIWGRRAPNEIALRRRLRICLRVYLVVPLFLGLFLAIGIPGAVFGVEL